MIKSMIYQMNLRITPKLFLDASQETNITKSLKIINSLITDLPNEKDDTKDVLDARKEGKKIGKEP